MGVSTDVHLARAVLVLPVLALALGTCGSGAEDRQTAPRARLSLQKPRAAHSATLTDGTVLLAGGCATDGCSTATATTKLYDPHVVVADPL